MKDLCKNLGAAKKSKNIPSLGGGKAALIESFARSLEMQEEGNKPSLRIFNIQTNWFSYQNSILPQGRNTIPVFVEERILRNVTIFFLCEIRECLYTLYI